MNREPLNIKKLKALHLHEITQLNDSHTQVMRVPNGLIYTYINYDYNMATSQFVPLNSDIDNIDNDNFGEKE